MPLEVSLHDDTAARRKGRSFAYTVSMTATITAAFIHHATAFIVVAALMVELVILRNDLTVP